MSRFMPLFVAAALVASASAAMAQSQTQPLMMDQPVPLSSGVTAVCTGIGSGTRDDPRWKAFPIRVEFANDLEQYLAGAHVTLTGPKGATLADFDCYGAWVLFQVPAGKYEVSAHLLFNKTATTASASFTPPASGQKRVVLIFKGVPVND